MSNLNKICDIKIANARKKAIILIKEFEGCKLKSYKCPANVWTIGYGNTNYLKSFVDPAKIGITQEKALSLLEDDVDVYFDCVVRQVGSLCNENQIASLTSFAFNLGNDKFLHSTLLKVVKAKSIDEAKQCCIEQTNIKFNKNKITKLQHQTLLKKINISTLQELITMQFMNWNLAGGEILSGLTRRREAEANLYKQ